MDYEEQFLTYIEALYDHETTDRSLSFAKLGTYEEDLFGRFFESSEFGDLLLGTDTDLLLESDDDELYALPEGPTGAQVDWYGHWEGHSRGGHFEFRFPYHEYDGGYQCLSIQGGYGRGGSVTRFVMMNRYLQTGYEGHHRESAEMNDDRWALVLPLIEQMAEQKGVAVAS